MNSLFTVYLYAHWPKLGFQTDILRGEDGGPLASPADLPDSLRKEVKSLDEALEILHQKYVPESLRRLVIAVMLRGWENVQFSEPAFVSLVKSLPECEETAEGEASARRGKKAARAEAVAGKKHGEDKTLVGRLLRLVRPSEEDRVSKALTPNQRFNRAVKLLGGDPGNYKFTIEPEPPQTTEPDPEPSKKPRSRRGKASAR